VFPSWPSIKNNTTPVTTSTRCEERAIDTQRNVTEEEDSPISPIVVVVDPSTGQIDEIRSFSSLKDNLELIVFPPGTTLLPGFIDCHVHLTIATDDYQLDHLRRSSAEKALRALKAAQGLLAAGFTTLRSAGDADVFFPSFAVAKSVERGEFIGPRIVGAGHYISVTGGGGDLNFLAPDSCPCCLTDGVIADGHDEVVKAVRNEIKFGSDWIKVLATGAFMSASTGAKDSPENTHFSLEELHACVQEAARRQVPVMAHAHGADGIRQAAIAGPSCLHPRAHVDRVSLHRARLVHRRRRHRGLSISRDLDRPHLLDRSVSRTLRVAHESQQGSTTRTTGVARAPRTA
jgi:imidazolonepropionase-like amidohydrolase